MVKKIMLDEWTRVEIFESTGCVWMDSTIRLGKMIQSKGSLSGEKKE